MRHLFFIALANAALAACGESSSVMEEITRAEKAEEEAATANSAEAQRFLAEVAARPGVRPTASGLLLETVAAGPDQSLPRPPREAVVLVHYEGALADGTVFDSSIARGEPAQFPLSGVIPGFAEALTTMRPGDTVRAYIPPDIGYGPAGSPPAIPGNAALVFRIQLLAFQGPDGRIVSAPRPPG